MSAPMGLHGHMGHGRALEGRNFAPMGQEGQRRALEFKICSNIQSSNSAQNLPKGSFHE